MTSRIPVDRSRRLTGTELATSTTIKRPNNFNDLPGDSAGPRTDRAPGFSDLESLLSQKGPLGSGTKFKMPNNQLFDYDSADLAGARSTIAKSGDADQAQPERDLHPRGLHRFFRLGRI